MCGIFGAIKMKDGYFGWEDFLKFSHLSDSVSHRGPDGSGNEAFDTSMGKISDVKSRFNVFLGHRRLSIIDLSPRGKQPFTNDGTIWITYNGEIFNYIELRSELKNLGVNFATDTDTEVIVNTYKVFGEEGFSKFNGMWAFALLDVRKNKVILSRDRFSMKPLYYTRQGDALYFASEIKQLLPLLDKRRENRHVLDTYLEQGLINHSQETFFEGIYQVTPKCNQTLDLRTGVTTESCYWDYNLETDNRDEMSVVEDFRELFMDSVRIRLRSDVKVGALLSGGLDSSAISMIAHDIQGGNFETYSMISNNKHYSEEKHIDRISRAGVKNRKIGFNTELNRETLEKVVWHNDEPFGGLSVVAQYRLLESLKRETDIVVVLSGQGGDETLLGYFKYYFFHLKQLARDRHFAELFRQLLLSFVRRTVVWQFNLTEALRYIPKLQARYCKPYLLHGVSKEPVWVCNDMRERQILDIDRYSVPALTHYEDRNSMAHSLEIRLPFLDHRLVNFALNLTTSSKLKGGWTKHILRKAIRELPSEIRWRRDKKGFSLPENDTLKTGLSPLILDLFKNSQLEARGFIDGRLFLSHYDQFRKGKGVIWAQDISRMLFAELWARKFLT